MRLAGWRWRLIAGLASEMAERQGVSGAIAFGRAARSLAVTAGFIWLMLLHDENQLAWAYLAAQGLAGTQGSLMILLITWVLSAINLFQLCGPQPDGKPVVRSDAPADGPGRRQLARPA